MTSQLRRLPQERKEMFVSDAGSLGLAESRRARAKASMQILPYEISLKSATSSNFHAVIQLESASHVRRICKKQEIVCTPSSLVLAHGLAKSGDQFGSQIAARFRRDVHPRAGDC